MKLSMKSKYGINCLIELAIQNKRCSINDISKNQKISLKYTESIFSSLKKAHLVISHRGLHGGYTLAKEPSRITLFEIINALEEKESIASKSGINDPLKRILRSSVWYKIDQDLKTYLSQIFLEDIIKPTA